MNDLQFAVRYQCLPIRCSGRLISLQNEHFIEHAFDMFPKYYMSILLGDLC
jgi:hypothetical protein